MVDQCFRRASTLFYVNITGRRCLPVMKESRLNLRISSRRLNKLRSYAASKDKTVTQIVEDWVDRLPNTEIGGQGTVPTQSSTDG
jgi:Holliday junction resolvasome RuvABC ATP-dependent DNA helicase subunit